MKKQKKDNADFTTDTMVNRRINWLPGHMVKAFKKIKERLKMVDIVLEIRDARSPLATGNESIRLQMGEKSRLIVINKTNLADPAIVKLWTDWFSKQDEPFVFVNCFNEKSLKQIVQLSKEIVNKKRIQSNPESTPKIKLRMMVVGLPNTGKSTIINRLANRNATKVADKPAQTQQLLWVTANKDLEILDTPGVMPPEIHNDEQGLWLSALHAIPDHIVEPETTACYVVKHLLKTNPAILKNRYKTDFLDNNLVDTLDQIAKARGYIRKKNEYDYDRVYKTILSDFRNGDLGPISFGLPPTDT